MQPSHAQATSPVLASLVGALPAELPRLALTHQRQRERGVLAVLEQGGEVRALGLHRCGLTALPACIRELTALERLDVGGNSLAELPPLPPGVRELFVDDNQLARFPELPPLRLLDANRNRLVEVPPLVDVEFVYVAANRLTTTPVTRGVRYLNVSDNPLSALVLDDAALSEVRAESCGLRELPASIGKLPLLRDLSLRGNQLTALPAEVAGLRSLRHLDLRGNLLDDLPAELAELPHLTKLDLRWNPLRRRPGWLTELAARGCTVYC